MFYFKIEKHPSKHKDLINLVGLPPAIIVTTQKTNTPFPRPSSSACSYLY